MESEALTSRGFGLRQSKIMQLMPGDEGINQASTWKLYHDIIILAALSLEGSSDFTYSFLKSLCHIYSET